MARLPPQTITDQHELAMVLLFRAYLALRVRRPRKYEFMFFVDGSIFDGRLNAKDEVPKIDLREGG